MGVARTGPERREPSDDGRRAPPPDPAAGEAEAVQPRRVVFLHPRRQDLPFPGGGRGLEPFELAEQGVEAPRPLGPAVGIDPLPGEEEAQEVGLRDRLDLPPQPVQGVAMDAGEEPALAPLLPRRARGEPAAEDEALAFERRQGDLDRAPPEAQARGERLGGDRPQAVQPAAHELDQRLLRGPLAGEAGGRRDRRLQRSPPDGAPGAAAAARRRSRDAHRRAGSPRRRPPGRGQASNSRSQPERSPSSAVTKPRVSRASCSSSGVSASGQASARTRTMALGVERAEVRGGLRIEPAAQRDRLGAALLERRVVQEGVGLGLEDLVGERRGLDDVAGDHRDLARLHAAQEVLQPLDVHRLFQAVAQGLLDQRVIGDLALAHDVLQAGELVGEDDRHQVLGGLAEQRRRHSPAAALARDGEGAAGVPAPAHAEQRRVEHRLGEDVARRVRAQEVEDVLQREAVGGAEGEHDGVLGGRRLQLEVEGAAEALAQGQPPGAVQAAAERRVERPGAGPPPRRRSARRPACPGWA